MHLKNKLLILSFLLLNLYNWVGQAEIDYGFPKIIKYLLAVFVISTFIGYSLANLLKPKPGKLFYLVLIFFIIWSLMLLISEGLKFNSKFYIQRLFGQPYYFIPYLLPILLLYTKFDLEFLRNFFKASFFFIIFAIIMQFFIILSGISYNNWDEKISRIEIFNIGSSFLLLTAQFSKKKYVFNIALFFSMVMLFFYLQLGSRGMSLEITAILVFMILHRLKSTLLYFKDRLKIYLALLLMIMFILSFSYLITSSYAFQRGFTKVAFLESRGSVFESFFYDFNSKSDWIFGRGLDGQILRSIREYRTFSSVENGFLTVLLKGGLLYLIPFVLILLRAVYLGFCRSNNEMVKALASLIFIYLFFMFYFNVPIFATKYIFLWISVCICFSPEIRDLSNEKIYEAINS